ncbi:MAG: hypothetical protein EA349_05030 [Halomonadaceae bacterium]|nr:MAG: hypothetical protein EA349_05030 [Halomonadaceae bacterium]
MPASLATLAPWLQRVAPLLYRQCSFSPGNDELNRWLAEHPRLLVVLNHGPALGPLPALTGLGLSFLAAGGQERVPFGLIWRGFYRLALVGPLTNRLAESPHELRVKDAVERLRAGPWSDCCILPEGDLANLGNGVDVQPFRSSRFVEIAVASEVPILLVAHQGTEKLARSLTVPDPLLKLRRWLPEHLRQPLARNRQVSLPWLLNGRVDHLRIRCELFTPSITADELAGPGGPRAVSREAQQVRSRLQRLVNQLVLEADLTAN